MARADLITSTILVLFGGAVVFESWRMPRFESIGGTFHNAPGLVPGMLGAIIALMGALMLVRSLRAMAGRPASAAPTASERFGGAQASSALPDAAAAGAQSDAEFGADAGVDAEMEARPEVGAELGGVPVPTEPEPVAHGYRRLAWILGLSLVYAAGLVGRMPFWLATFLYVFSAIVVFERPEHTNPRRTVTRIAVAAVIAGATAWAVPFVFEKIFLVNLP